MDRVDWSLRDAPSEGAIIIVFAGCWEGLILIAARLGGSKAAHDTARFATTDNGGLFARRSAVSRAGRLRRIACRRAPREHGRCGQAHRTHEDDDRNGPWSERTAARHWLEAWRRWRTGFQMGNAIVISQMKGLARRRAWLTIGMSTSRSRSHATADAHS